MLFSNFYPSLILSSIRFSPQISFFFFFLLFSNFVNHELTNTDHHPICKTPLTSQVILHQPPILHLRNLNTCRRNMKNWPWQQRHDNHLRNLNLLLLAFARRRQTRQRRNLSIYFPPLELLHFLCHCRNFFQLVSMAIASFVATADLSFSFQFSLLPLLSLVDLRLWAHHHLVLAATGVVKSICLNDGVFNSLFSSFLRSSLTEVSQCLQKTKFRTTDIYSRLIFITVEVILF